MNNLKRIISLALCIMLLVLFAVPAQAASPRVIMINNARDLIRLSQNCRLDEYSKELTVVLAADIDMAGTDFEPIPIFSGNFHGNGYRITGLHMSQESSSRGFFRILTQEAKVSDLHLEGSLVCTGGISDTGGIAGINHGQILHCSYSGTVSGSDRVGGIAGTNSLTGIIEDSQVYGTIHGIHFTGGIAGENNGVIRNCENHAAVNTTVEQNSVALEDITIDSLVGTEAAITVTDIGGICGSGTGILRECSNHGDVGYPRIGYNIGGIAGSFSGYITDCVNHNPVNGRKEVGGIVGQLEPAVSIQYAQDTVQTLQVQMNQMSGTAASAGGHIQNGANALTGFSDQLSVQIRNAQDALALLAPDPNNPQLPDMDTLEAARNALGSSLSGISSALSTMIGTGMDSFSGLTQDIHSLTNQMNQIGGTIGSAAENLGGSIGDISDLDTAADISAKVDQCQNLGNVSGDWNVGGVVGAIAPENDLDPESDLQLIGTSSFNFDISLRAVVDKCDNDGTVTGKKQNVGGIVGWSSLGLIRNCVNTAAVDGTNGNYTGGIAGQSLGYIRSCSAKCTIWGDAYVGGIAGTGATVTDCRSIVYLEGVQEKYGAILGVLDDAMPENNYYLHDGKDPGAIDGISYAGKGQALDADAFFDLEGLPGSFRLVTVTFCFDDGTTKEAALPFGSALAAVGFPAIPAESGKDAHWEGPIGLSDAVTRDVTFHIVSAEHVYTLESLLKNDDGFPQFLLQGQFRPGAVLTVNPIAAEGYTAAWSLILPESMTSMQLRCRLPKGCSGSDTLVELRLPDSSWEAVAAQQQGSYLVLSLPQGVTGIRLLHEPQSILPYLIGGIALVLLLIIVIVTVICVKKKKKK